MKLTHTVLDEIVRLRKIDIDALKIKEPLDTFQNALLPSDRDFYAALNAKKAARQPAFILECKKASPSKGLIRDDFDVTTIVETYNCYATAISVLTEHRHFQGEFHYLELAKAASDKPILCKDFVVDAYQIYKARFHGANAILLMLSVLDDAEYEALASVAHSLKMGVLTEVNDEAEVARALALNAKVIGINNRDLRDLSIDLGKTERLAKLMPKEQIIISESGILEHGTMKELTQFADGFLIGSALMAETNLDQAVRKMVNGPHKVCGLTSSQDAQAAYDAGASFGGLIFVPNSPRAVTLDEAKSIIDGVNLGFIGVFQNESIDEIVTIATALNLAGIQLHGEESGAYIENLQNALVAAGCPSIKLIKALSIKADFAEMMQAEETPFCELLTLHRDGVIDYLLLDGKKGGSGTPFNWTILQEAPLKSHLKRSFLAGGLNQDNLVEALAFNSYGVDINSGAERAPGKKDAGMLNTLFQMMTDNLVGAKQ